MHRRSKWAYLFTLPYMINLTVFFYIPVIFSLYIAFTQWDFFNPPKFIGLSNWTTIVNDERFIGALRNIFLFTLVVVPLQAFLALIVAYLLNMSIRFKGFFRFAYFLPVITPWVAGGLLWVWIYNYDFGILNWLLGELGIPKVNWLDHELWWVVILSIAFVNVWKSVGYSMILLLAGMQNVSSDLREAAKIDGAGEMTIFLKIVIPLVSPMIYLVMILATISSFQAFDVFLIMADANLNVMPDRTMVPNMMIYREAFLYSRMGSASAMAWFLFAIIMIFTIIQRLMEKKWVHYENN
ncbi:MAG TPA: sugar ABC transporter permease [Candidatus Paenibacillus intestinavium]|nr:sugar ABC transporter permease [Candidatus Paenibacillus intestinavium]